jgi:hypothetical protein
MNIRELRVTDIGCSKCGAHSGEECRVSVGHNICFVRIVEHQNLVADGWKWQNVDPADVGAADKKRQFCDRHSWCTETINHVGQCISARDRRWLEERRTKGG